MSAVHEGKKLPQELLYHCNVCVNAFNDRKSLKRHKKSVQKLGQILSDNDDIYLSKYSGWYSVSDEAFYNDDEVIDKNGIKISKISSSQVEWMPTRAAGSD